MGISSVEWGNEGTLAQKDARRNNVQLDDAQGGIRAARPLRGRRIDKPHRIG